MTKKLPQNPGPHKEAFERMRDVLLPDLVMTVRNETGLDSEVVQRLLWMAAVESSVPLGPLADSLWVIGHFIDTFGERIAKADTADGPSRRSGRACRLSRQDHSDRPGRQAEKVATRRSWRRVLAANHPPSWRP